MRRHKQSKHLGILYKCDICDYKTGFKDHLNRHNRQVHKKEIEDSFKCQYCDFKAKEKRLLRLHNQSKHWHG